MLKEEIIFMKQCNKEKCINNATHQVQLSLAVNANHEPAISTPILFLCNDHKNDYTKDDMFGPIQWKQICDGFTNAGKAAPKKEFSDIIISPIPLMN